MTPRDAFALWMMDAFLRELYDLLDRGFDPEGLPRVGFHGGEITISARPILPKKNQDDELLQLGKAIDRILKEGPND